MCTLPYLHAVMISLLNEVSVSLRFRESWIDARFKLGKSILSDNNPVMPQYIEGIYLCDSATGRVGKVSRCPQEHRVSFNVDKKNRALINWQSRKCRECFFSFRYG